MAVAAGRLTSRVRMERVVRSDDGYGNVLTSGWADLGSRWADVRSEPGREALAAGRQESTVRAVIVLRRCELTLSLTAADRLVVTAGPMAGKTFNIRTAASPTMSEVELTCEAGVAT